jgi:HlyD family secretion protein
MAVPAAQPGLQQPGVQPQAAPAVVAPKTIKPGAPKKSWTTSSAARIGKWVGLALVAGGTYLGYTAYQRRQPYEWSGAVEMRTVAVGSRIGGRVTSVLVREGQQVMPGDVLVVLAGGPLQAEKAIAEADVQSALAVTAKLENGARPEEVAQAMAKLAAARAFAGQASGLAQHESLELARTKNLLNHGAVSSFDHEAVLARTKSAFGAVAQAGARAKEEEAALRLLTSGTRPEDLRVARAQLEVARAKLDLVNGQLEELNIRAPNRARVEAITVRPGDILRADARAVTLLENGQLYVRIYVPEPRLGNIHVGENVPVSVDSFPNRTFRGRIDHINEVGEYTPRRLITTEERADEVFAAKIALLEGDTELKAGMAAFIHVKK